ncbi:MAG: DUF4932 domain-containing protein [Bacteroidales bacterium]|nr:DUF4932 domain-containing protein [Candidatus Egerieousia equi]
MKRVFVIIILLFIAVDSCWANINVKIDERVELTSIVFRLAEAEEFHTSNAPAYLKDIDNYFDKYSSHPLIKYVKELRNNDSLNVAYGVVAASSFLFDIKAGKIVFDLNDNFGDYYFKYWDYASLVKYLNLLRQFYKDTRFSKFWEAHKAMSQKSLETAKSVVKGMNINAKWFSDFFDTDSYDFDIYLGMANGGNNYAVQTLDENKCKSIMIGCFTEIDGVPSIDSGISGVLFHELCHRFGNQVVDEYKNEFMSSFERIYPDICQLTKLYGYGDSHPYTAAVESFINLFSIMYKIENAPFDMGYFIAESENQGHIWMADAVEFMQSFLDNRERFPSIKAFMPQLVAYYNELPERWVALMKKFEARAPYVESTFPAKNSTVSSDIKELRVTFSHPMIDAFGKRKLNGYENVVFHEVHHSPDNRTIIIPLSEPLKKGKTYGFVIPAAMLISADTYHRVEEDYQFIFKTEK